MKYACLLTFILMFRFGFSQHKSELPFIEHLINKGYYKEVIYLIDSDSLKYQQSQQDSLNYYKGWANYSLKNLDQSTRLLLKVGKESSFYLKSRFFAGYNQIFLGNYPEARKIFSQLEVKDEPNSSLVNFELSGIDMLQGDLTQAEEQIKLVNANIPTINQQVQELGKLSKNMRTHHRKSAFLAGAMSAIIPGSGKIYAGKTGQGIASMIATTGFGLITWENYRKLGIKNAKTILFGSIFAANYTSNIYGSVVSVRIIENEYQDAVHNQILFQLHIPLRNFFD